MKTKDDVLLEEMYTKVLKKQRMLNEEVYIDMTKDEFIQKTIKDTNNINKLIQNISKDFEIDWRDFQEVEIHNVDTDTQAWRIVEALNKNGFKVEHWDFRYSETLRIYFVDEYYGSYGLEDQDPEEIDAIFDGLVFKSNNL